MVSKPRVHFDNAATSWTKPQTVCDAVNDYQRRLGAAVGRGGYAETKDVGEAVARLIGAEGPKRLIFTFNGTNSLNWAIHGTLKTGGHVVASVAEHKTVLRPLCRLEKRNRNGVTRVGCDSAGVIDPDDIRAALRPETKLFILTQASNVAGAIQPSSQVARITPFHRSSRC